MAIDKKSSMRGDELEVGGKMSAIKEGNAQNNSY